MDKSLFSVLKDARVVAIVCNQWGDTGKGKIVNYLAKEWADVVARGNGGNNAGHTVVLNNEEVILHLIPCGIFNPDVYNIIGPGTVIDPFVLLEEINTLKNKGVKVDKLRVSGYASVITPLHIVADCYNKKIGTTGRGVGPAYRDRAGRNNIRINDLMNPDVLKERLSRLRDSYSFDPESLERISGHPAVGRFITQGKICLEAIIENLIEVGKEIGPFVCDASKEMYEFFKNGKRIVVEGAQGLLLGIEEGTYPYVTSSCCSALHVVAGAGLPANLGNDLKVFGVVKFPVMTRVGNGPMPTEIGTEANDRSYKEEQNYDLNGLKEKALSGDQNSLRVFLRLKGKEYGATTGRPRRIGWIDLVALRYAVRMNGPNIILTKIDCCPLPAINICDKYIYQGIGTWSNGKAYSQGGIIRNFPTDSYVLKNCIGSFEKRPWYKNSLRGIRDYEGFPQEVRNTLNEIEEKTGCNVVLISNGPNEEDIIVK